MASLLERAMRLREVASDVFQARAELDRHESLSGRAEEFGVIAHQLAADRDHVEALIDSDAVEASEFVGIDLGEALRTVKALREKAQDDPQALVSGNAFAQTLTKVSSAHTLLQSSYTRAWQGLVAKALSTISDDDLAFFQEVNPASVAPISALRAELRRQSTLPPNRAEVERFLGEARQLDVLIESAWSSVFGEGQVSRSEIQEFVNAAKTEKGADLSGLTPDVVTWLKHVGLVPRIGIFLRRAGRRGAS